MKDYQKNGERMGLSENLRVQPPATPQEPAPSIDCPLCGEEVRQVSSATLSLALWQHVRWVCRRASTPSPEGTQP